MTEFFSGLFTALSSNLFANLTLAATAIILLVTAAASLLLYASTRKIAVLRSSFEHIAIQTRDADLIEMFEQLRRVRHAASAGEVALTYKNMQRDFKYDGTHIYADNIIKKTFNYYEATCIGIKRGALEEQMIEDWWGDAMVSDWIDFQQYVDEARDALAYRGLYIEVEYYVRRWIKPELAGKLLSPKR